MPLSAYSLTICGVHELNELATQPITHLVSIWHPGANRDSYTTGVNALFPDAKILFIVFDDVEQAINDTDQPPDIDQVRELLEFGKLFTGDSVVGVHCMAGISRSSAAAITLLTDQLGPGSELDVAEHVKAMRPQARPNRLILQLADQLLDRDAALTKAADSVFGTSAATRNKGW